MAIQPRPSRPQATRAPSTAHALAVLASAAVVLSCGGDPPVGPDALRPELFQLVGVSASPLPAFAWFDDPPGTGSAWLRSAELKSIEPGRTIDPRIFGDRSGTGGTGGGGSRDSTTVSARMADVRVFEGRAGRTLSTALTGTFRDSMAVTVERRGDLLLIRREHPDPLRNRVDTGRFDAGQLVVTVGNWDSSGFRVANKQFTYTVTRQ